jgi:PAS domain S-box-containing protein
VASLVTAPDAREAPRPGEPLPNIREVAAVRRQLDELAAARDQAQADRMAIEQEARARLDASFEALSASEARLSAVLRTAADGVLTLDASLVIVAANPAALALFRCDSAQLLGSMPWQWVPQRHVDRLRAGILEIIQSDGAAQTFLRTGLHQVLTLRCADGQELVVEGALSLSAGDTQPFYVVILRDISVRRQAEKALQSSNAKLESALAAMGDSVFITDAQGRLTDFNDAFVTTHRLSSRQECEGTLAEYPERLDVFLPTGEPVPLEQWPASRALRGESAVNVEFALRRRGQDDIWVNSYSFAPIRGLDGGIVGSVTSNRDMTEIRKVQEALLQSHRDLRQMVAQMHLVEERERQRIARELHDELQQSLGVIRLDLVAIGRQCVADGAGAAVLAGQTVALVDGAITSVRRIVSDLRPQILDELGLSAALESMVRNFGDRHGLDATLDILGRVAGDGHGAIEDPPAAVASALYRITQEALNNVRKHAEAGFVYVFLDLSSADRIELLVHDDGRGLPPADPAQPVSFGLRGMRERAEALGGTLVLQSDPGGGTTVRAWLPRWPQGGSAVGSGAAPAPALGLGVTA